MKKRTTRKPAPIQADPDTIHQALDELGENRPFYSCRVVGNRLEFAMYGGDVITWPPTAGKSSPPNLFAEQAGGGQGKEK